MPEEESLSPGAIPFVRRARVVLAAMLMVTVSAAFGSCAKSPTTILATISVDDTVPPVLELRATVAQVSDPSRVAINLYSSLFPGDAADRPAPFIFPLRMPISVPPSWAGGVTVVIEGLDWVTMVVNATDATGTTTVELNPQHKVETMVTLTGIAPGGGGDGGGAGGEAGAGDDGALDAGSDDDGAVVDDAAVDNDAATD